AVKINQAGSEPIVLAAFKRRIDPRRNRAVRRGDGERRNRFQLRWLGVGDQAPLQIELTRFLWRDRVVGRPAGFQEGLVDRGGIGIENNGHDLPSSSFRGEAKPRTMMCNRTSENLVPQTSGFRVRTLC